MSNSLFTYALRMGDTHNVLAHRMAEWCSNGPTLEEDIAMTNIGLDHIGAARAWLTYAGEVEGKGRDEDAFAFHRNEREYFNMLIAELPNGNFAATIARNLMFDLFAVNFYEQLLKSADETLSGIAAKVIKEAKYHLRHTVSWTVRLGNGTEESHQKMQAAVNEVWRFTGNMFEVDNVDQDMIDAGIGVDVEAIHTPWLDELKGVLAEANITLPENDFMISGSKIGQHTEGLGHMLATMQWLPRAYPDAKW
jgi:ring-1,2-phenylacetyl-CoA epoxidase subunit PaaC